MVHFSLRGLLLALAFGSQATANLSVVSSHAGGYHHAVLARRDALSAALSIQSAIEQMIAAISSGLLGAASLIPARTTARPVWNWGTDKAIGICLGNWLTLERFMDEDWFVGLAGNDAEDEWTFTQNLGSARAIVALQAHYNDFIKESDFDVMVAQGINHIRIPTGFWTWIPTVPGEPYVNAGQLAQLERAVKYAYDRGMYVLIDLHGLPGSQNGEESSGHLTSNAAFFNNAANQARSDTLVSVVMAWIANNPYRSIISGLEVINEPRPYGAAQIQELSNYYARSYATMQASAYPVAMFLHPGFIDNPFPFWESFVRARVTNPPSIVIEDHPYPGNFPIQYNQNDMLNQVCSAAKRYLNYPIPVAITEWSLYTGVRTSSFERQFYEAQLTAWAWSAGSFYWSYRVIPSRAQLAAGLDYSQYSFAYLVNERNQVIKTPGDAGLPNTTNQSNARAYLSSLSAQCGPVPYNASPYQ